MPYEPIPPDELVEPERRLMPAGRTKEATTRLLARLPDVAAYGFFLIPDTRHPAAAVLRDRWSELDHRSGNRFALVAFQPPAAWAKSLTDRWRADLGPEFEQAWQDWQDGYGLEPGAAYDYLGHFTTDPPLRAADLPCLVIFTSLEDRTAIVRPIPDWTEDEIFGFLCAVIDQVLEHLDTPAGQRVEALRVALTAPSARMRTTLGHLADRTVGYLMANPATVVATALGVVIALGTGNILPLSAGMLTALTSVRKIFKGS